MCGRMVVKIDGKAYFHQFHSQDGAWEFVPAPSKYDDLPVHDEAREVAPKAQVWVHRVEGRGIVPEPAFWTLVPPWTESVSRLATAADARRGWCRRRAPTSIRARTPS